MTPEFVIQILRQSLIQWERHRRLIEERVAFLEGLSNKDLPREN